MRSLLLGMSVTACAAMPLITCAEQKTVQSGTTVIVESSEVSSWAKADINIEEGATLVFSEPTQETFTGTITGSGNFVAKAVSESVVPKMLTMNGNASGFTGAFFFSNVFFTVSNPQSVGSVARMTLYTAYTGDTGSKSLFLGADSGDDFVYPNDIDVRVPVKSGGCSALAVKRGAVLSGSVLHRYGMLLGPGRITGHITSSSKDLYVGDDLHIEGAVTFTDSGAKLANYAMANDDLWGYPKSGSLYLKGRTENLATFNPIDCYYPVYLEGDNLFGENVELVVGANSSSSGRKSFRLELNGHSQIFKSAAFVATPADSLKEIGGIGNAGAPATVSFVNQTSAQWFLGRLDGHLSVRVSGPTMLGFSVPTNSMDGTITHSGERGGNIVMEGAWPNLKKIESVNGGVIDIRSSVTINPKATIDIDDSSRIKVATGLTLTVRTLRINGVELPIGTYSRFLSAVDGHFGSSGDGYVKVTGAPGFKVLIK